MIANLINNLFKSTDKPIQMKSTMTLISHLFDNRLDLSIANGFCRQICDWHKLLHRYIRFNNTTITK